MVLLRIFLLCNVCFLPLMVQAQLKYERESRIGIHEVPAAARDFIGRLSHDQKVKWYLEESLQDKSIEAKFKWHKQRYSIEFDTAGKLQDVEIELASSELDANVRNRINEALEERFVAHKITKIQLQYMGETEELNIALNQQLYPTSLSKRYELIVKGKEQRQPKLYEITFDEEGNLISQKEIILKNADNLEY